jgi:hypothetical protein
MIKGTKVSKKETRLQVLYSAVFIVYFSFNEEFRDY